jgi:hypothetical protein
VELVVVDWDDAMLEGEMIPEQLQSAMAHDPRYPAQEEHRFAETWFNTWSLKYVVPELGLSLSRWLCFTRFVAKPVVGCGRKLSPRCATEMFGAMGLFLTVVACALQGH